MAKISESTKQKISVTQQEIISSKKWNTLIQTFFSAINDIDENAVIKNDLDSILSNIVQSLEAENIAKGSFNTLQEATDTLLPQDNYPQSNSWTITSDESGETIIYKWFQSTTDGVGNWVATTINIPLATDTVNGLLSAELHKKINDLLSQDQLNDEFVRIDQEINNLKSKTITIDDAQRAAKIFLDRLLITYNSINNTIESIKNNYVSDVQFDSAILGIQQAANVFDQKLTNNQNDITIIKSGNIIRDFDIQTLKDFKIIATNGINAVDARVDFIEQTEVPAIKGRLDTIEAKEDLAPKVAALEQTASANVIWNNEQEAKITDLQNDVIAVEVEVAKKANIDDIAERKYVFTTPPTIIRTTSETSTNNDANGLFLYAPLNIPAAYFGDGDNVKILARSVSLLAQKTVDDTYNDANWSNNNFTAATAQVNITPNAFRVKGFTAQQCADIISAGFIIVEVWKTATSGSAVDAVAQAGVAEAKADVVAERNRATAAEGALGTRITTELAAEVTNRTTADTQIRTDFAAADTATLNAAKAYTDAHVPTIDLSAYSTTTQMNAALALKADQTTTNTALDAKADKTLGNVTDATFKAKGIAAGLATDSDLDAETNRATTKEGELEDLIDDKLDKNQGAANAGKILGIGADGVVVPQDAPTGGGGLSFTEIPLDQLATYDFTDKLAYRVRIYTDFSLNEVPDIRVFLSGDIKLKSMNETTNEHKYNCAGTIKDIVSETETSTFFIEWIAGDIVIKSNDNPLTPETSYDIPIAKFEIEN